MQSSKFYKWFVVGMLWFVCFFNYADRQAIFSVFPLLKTELQLSDVQLGIIGASFMWMYALFGPVAGWIGDRVSRKGLILGALVFWSAITASTALCHTYLELTIVRALGGLGEAFYFPAAMSLIGDYHGPETRSRAMGLHQSGVYAGTIAGGGFAGLLGQYYGWKSSFVMFGIAGIVLGLLLLGLLREPKRGQLENAKVVDEKPVGILQELGEIFHNRMAPTLMAIFVGANFVAMVFLTWLPSFLYRKFQMSLTMAGFSGTAYLQIASVLGVLTGGIVADKLAKNHPGGRMLAQAVGLFCGVPFLFLTGWTLSIPVLVLAMSGFGYFKGLYDANIWASLYDVVPTNRRATALGLMNSIGWLGGSAAPIFIATASERYGMSACISATSLIYLFLGVAMVVGVRKFVNRRPDMLFAR